MLAAHVRWPDLFHFGMRPMTTSVYLVIACAVAYLVGGIPFGYIIGRVVGGIDIRSEGSGNIGATNVARVLGLRWGVAVLVPDALKGLGPVWAVSATMNRWVEPVGPDSVMVVHGQVLVGVMAILGHMFPCWIGLRGGKGVATALGVVVLLSPWGTLAAVGLYVLTLATSRLGSLGSLLGALAFGVVQTTLMVRAGDWSPQWSLSAFTLAVPLLIIYRHRSNIGRIVRGEEPSVGQPVADDPELRDAFSAGDDSSGEVNSVQDGP